MLILVILIQRRKNIDHFKKDNIPAVANTRVGRPFPIRTGCKSNRFDSNRFEI